MGETRLCKSRIDEPKLKDQAARLEKTMGNLSGNTNENEDTRLEEDVINSTKENQGKIEADNRDIKALATQCNFKDEMRGLPSYVAARNSILEKMSLKKEPQRVCQNITM